MDAIKGLQELGFSLNAARAYRALLTNPQSTGYEVGKHSGVPRAKVYEVLEGLIESGAVLVSHEDGKRLYRAVPPDLLLERREASVRKVISELKPALSELEESSEDPPLMTVKGRRHALQRAEELCDEATKSLLVVGFPSELENISEALVRAQERGVEVFALIFGEMDLNLNHLFHHSVSSLQYRQVDRYGRWLGVVRDVEEVLLSQFRPDGATSLWTANLGVVLAVTMWIQHDVAVHIMLSGMSSEVIGQIQAKTRDNPALLKLWNLTVHDAEEGQP